jgi:hypothetical protein
MFLLLGFYKLVPLLVFLQLGLGGFLLPFVLLNRLVVILLVFGFFSVSVLMGVLCIFSVG